VVLVASAFRAAKPISTGWAQGLAPGIGFEHLRRFSPLTAARIRTILSGQNEYSGGRKNASP
jgi:hypothetical protein